MKMPEINGETTDAEIVATFAIQALQENRFELAAALTRIAVQASRVRSGPSALHTREQVENAATAIFGRPVLVADGIPDSNRCTATVRRDGVADQCRVVVFWRPEHPIGWHHVDPAWDDDHPVELG
jgi:hypothetical protein